MQRAESYEMQQRAMQKPVKTPAKNTESEQITKSKVLKKWATMIRVIQLNSFRSLKEALVG